MIIDSSWKLLEEYAGPDRVVDSFEMRDWLKDQPPGKNFKCGLPTVDKLLDGFEQGELIAVSGPRKNGKTLLCQSITYAFNSQDVRPLWFEYEVSSANFFRTFSDKGLPYFTLPRNLKQGSLEWLEERIAEALVKFGSGIVFIDHLHFIIDLEKIRNPSLEIGSIIRKLKRIAVDYGVIIFLLCHMTKITKDEEPSDANFRDTSFISQESDVGLVIFRERTGKDTSWLKVCYSRRTGVFDEKIKLRKVEGVLVESDEVHYDQKEDYKRQAAGEF